MEFYQPKIQDDESIRKEINGEGRHLMFLSATWCPECKMIKPFIRQIKNEVSQTAEWFDVDRDANIKIAKEQNIHSMPKFVLYEDGKYITYYGDGQALKEADVLTWYRSTLKYS
ncbi:thioredoxin family protein [Oenococcus sp. UCMA 16435]|nr:thioredoxin family protein [Oenococcus sp. UCMA 16435]MDI4584184.1 thioredoxin [Oenococcus sp. UCMA 14587]